MKTPFALVRIVLTMARKRTRAQRTQAKDRRIEKDFPAAPIPSQWILLAREFMLRPPFLIGYQAASLIYQSRPRYYASEDFTVIY